MTNETKKYLDYGGLVLYDKLMKATIDKDGEVIATALTDLDNRINNIQLTPGQPGLDGTDGKSAYEIAQDNGFQGSEQDWLASLVGPSGQNGTNGTNGKNLEFDWDGTSLGVRQQGESLYSYVNLKGDPGTNGTNGTDGISPSVSVSAITNGHKISITDSTHDSLNPLEFNVMDGTATLEMTGASVDNTGAEPINVAGASGLVPAPTAGDHNKFLRGDGTWATVSGGGGPSGSGYAMIGDLDSEVFVPNFSAENDTVHVTSLELTSSQKALARTNIDAVSLSELTSGLATKAATATTLSGYGITDANISGGVITLGSNTITPVTDISGKEDKITIISQSNVSALTAEVGKYYRFTSNVGTLAITLPVPSDTTYLTGIMFYFTTGSSLNVTFTSSATIKKYNGFEITTSSTYEVNAVYNGSVWVVAATKLV